MDTWEVNQFTRAKRHVANYWNNRYVVLHWCKEQTAVKIKYGLKLNGLLTTEMLQPIQLRRFPSKRTHRRFPMKLGMLMSQDKEMLKA